MSLLIIVILTGCARLSEGVHIYNNSTFDHLLAEEIFESDQRLVSANVIFHKDQLVSGVAVKTFSRFHKKKIEKELKAQLEEVYPKLQITVSADNKIVHKTSKIIQHKEQEQLSEKLEKIVSLLKEET